MILDSTALIDYLRGKENAVKAVNSANNKAITTVNIFEISLGHHLRNNKNEEIRFNEFINSIKELELDRKSAIRSAEISARLIKEGKRIEETDCLIAGIALSNGVSTILTDNKSHFERIKGIKVVTY